MTIAELDGIPEPDAAAALRSCCGSSRWVTGMLAHRPFSSREALLAAADRMWTTMSSDDWREAFSHHPRIGARQAPAREAEEQSGMQTATATTRGELAELNRQYQERFGYIYIVCATGKSAQELLQLLRSRLGNAPDAELRIAAREQRQITRLRLEQLVR